MQSAAPSADLAPFAELLFADQPEAAELFGTAGPIAAAAETFQLLQQRARGQRRIRLRTLELSSVERPELLTLVEIINDDMPFLVDSVMGEIAGLGAAVRLVAHPIIRVERAEGGAYQRMLGAGARNGQNDDPDTVQESVIVILLDALNPEQRRDLMAAISTALDDVRVAVSDWQTMVARVQQAASRFVRPIQQVGADLCQETLAFCRWLVDGHFTLLGLTEFALAADRRTLTPITGSGLGLLRADHNPSDPSPLIDRTGDPTTLLPDSPPLIIAKSSAITRVHRRAPMDDIGLKTYDAEGKITGEIRLLGLFTSSAYTQSPREIPLLRQKFATVLAHSGAAEASHSSKALANVLETFPRDELFQITEGQLLDWSRGVVDLELRPRVRVFARPDRFDRFVSALVYVPRDRFSTKLRVDIGRILSTAYDGHISAFTPYFPEGPLVRVHFIISREGRPLPAVDRLDLERQIAACARTFDDKLSDVLVSSSPETRPDTRTIARKYVGAFSAGYAEAFSPERAVHDIARIERLSPERPTAIDFYRDANEPDNRLHAAIYRFDTPIPLSERVPVMENLGLNVIDEQSYRVHPTIAGVARTVALHDMRLESADGQPVILDDLNTGLDTRIEATYLAVSAGDADNDPFNRLVVSTGATWREAAVIRALAAYMRQIRSPFGLRYIADVMNRHAGVTRDMIELFHVRFDPARTLTMEQRTSASDTIRIRLDKALAKIESLDEDRILRSMLNLIFATVRTNFFQVDAGNRPPQALTFKLDSKRVDGMPAPTPFREIWVYSPRVEGVHLRFAAIARGGLRWSDRAQDFRTEVLGLCKAQQVKNTVIVPAGAKGGFVPKQMPRGGSRDEIAKEGIACYRIFVSAMLDITDNLVDGNVVPPANVVRHEGDDPYLVVAADKGTATFSDTANALAKEHNFWLGDAFASGGSVGYDHKKMAITARGAFECIARHFREIDINIQTTPFRVTGVGDMSGDVFGNGMLLSPAIKLVAAFDHRDIFLDPRPDVAQSFAERQRMFALPRSSWQDYDKSKLSAGGGIFSRTSKSIPLSAEVRALLALSAEAVTPAELMNAILKCETDLLYFGGIGTYVRGASETDDQVGDRANDAIRVTGSELRAKVVGEGANLALTQRGRIEFAQRGGRINTDFIDNSAGVNSSDQEVNIKIALSPAVASGRLPASERTAFLATMTDDVAQACLTNNIHQGLAISLAERRGARDLGLMTRLMTELETRGLLDRKLEALPTNAELRAREASGQGLTRPEIAVLLSVSKIALDHDLLASKVPDYPAFEPFLINYFPKALRERFPEDLKSHRLAREIVATFIVNAMINRGGPAFVTKLSDATGRSAADIALAFMAMRSAFDLSPLWGSIHGLANAIPGQLQLDLYAKTEDLIIEQTTELLRAGPVDDVERITTDTRTALETLTDKFTKIATQRQRQQLQDTIERWTAKGVPEPVARKIAVLEQLGSLPALTKLAAHTNRSIETVARITYAVGDHLRLSELKARAAALKTTDYFDRLASDAAIGDLDNAARRLTADILKAGPSEPDFATWQRGTGAKLAGAKANLDALATGGEISASRLTVAASQLRDIA
jgi:glutamate dehydrogenase